MNVIKLSRLLMLGVIAALCAAFWSTATFPIIKRDTRFIVEKQLPQYIDRANLTVHQQEQLDRDLARLIGNDQIWSRYHTELHRIAAIGFLTAAAVFAYGALAASRLERRGDADS